MGFGTKFWYPVLVHTTHTMNEFHTLVKLGILYQCLGLHEKIIKCDNHNENEYTFDLYMLRHSKMKHLKSLKNFGRKTQKLF